MMRFLKYYTIALVPLLLFVGTVIGVYYSTLLPWPLMLIAIVLMLAFDSGVAFCAIGNFSKMIFFNKTLKKEECLEKISNETKNQSKILVTGGCSHALGINTRLATNGLCAHPNKRSINPDRLDGLPISERDWTHCIFCRDMKHCYFAGDCEHRLLEQEKNDK